MMTDIETLANAFGRVLRTWLDASEMATVIQRNRTPEYGRYICASHDFCDANMAMAQAFMEAFGREPDVDGDEDVALWNAAWSLAKANDFVVRP